MEKKYDQNSHIVYVDPKGVPHSALATVWWDGNDRTQVAAYIAASGEPGCNLVYVTEDGSKKDPYGRQLERSTSVVHKSKQAAHGNFWCWPDEMSI
jgi:hypothetical protein